MTYMYFTKQDILEAEHELLREGTKKAGTPDDLSWYVNGIVELVEKLFINNAEKENS